MRRQPGSSPCPAFQPSFLMVVGEFQEDDQDKMVISKEILLAGMVGYHSQRFVNSLELKLLEKIPIENPFLSLASI